MFYETNKINQLENILELSKDVFSPSKEDALKYHDKADWLNKINKNGLLISVKDKNKYIAFAICYQKEERILHIWNVGVQGEYRRMGIWKEIYQRILDYAIEKGYKYLTLNTYENKFPNMYKFAKREEFILTKKEITTNGDIKSCFIKEL